MKLGQTPFRASKANKRIAGINSGGKSRTARVWDLKTYSFVATNIAIPMTPLRRLAFVVNADKTGACDLADDLVALAAASGVETRLTREFPLPSTHLQGMDACCVIGGDGTLLGVAPAAAEAGVPLIGAKS